MGELKGRHILSPHCLRVVSLIIFFPAYLFSDLRVFFFYLRRGRLRADYKGEEGASHWATCRGGSPIRHLFSEGSALLFFKVGGFIYHASRHRDHPTVFFFFFPTLS